MKFADARVSESTFKKTEFLKLVPGIFQIRLIGGNSHLTYTHYVNRVTVECIDEGCPICERNKQIIAENPSNYRDIPGYSYPRATYYVNILDRTVVKKCTNCKNDVLSVNNMYASACPFCSASLLEVEAQPSNTVKVLSRGKELFKDQFETINNTTLDAEGNVIGIENYDIRLRVPESRRPNAGEMLNAMDVVEYNEEDLYDLTDCVIKLDADEINVLLSGVTLKDIFATRKQEQAIVSSELTEELNSAIEDTVSSLMD